MLRYAVFTVLFIYGFPLSTARSDYLNSVDTSSDTEALKNIVVKTLLLPCIRRDEASLVHVNAVGQCLEENPLDRNIPTAEEFCRSGKAVIDCLKTALSACDIKIQEIMEAVIFGDFRDMCKQNFFESPKVERKRNDYGMSYGAGQDRNKRFNFETKVTRNLEKMDQKLDYVVALLSGNLAMLKEFKENNY